MTRANSNALSAALGIALTLAPLVASAGQGTVDWEKRVVRCDGLGAPSMDDAAGNIAVARPTTERVARREAERTCREAIRAMRVKGVETVGEVLDRAPAAARAVEALLQRALREGQPRYFTDGGAGISLKIALDGALTRALLGVIAAEVRGALAPGEGEAKNSPGVGAPTGVLVDATAWEVVPALAPRLLDPEGHALSLAPWGLRALETGGAAYARGPDRASRELSSRLGDAPLIVRAIGTRGVDLILTASDARALRENPLLAQGRVVVLWRGAR